jgi:hypothetical protein
VLSASALAFLIPWAALVPLVVVSVAFQVYCLVDLAGAEVRLLPKWAWGLLILLTTPIGGLVYLLAGREET